MGSLSLVVHPLDPEVDNGGARGLQGGALNCGNRCWAARGPNGGN